MFKYILSIAFLLAALLVLPKNAYSQGNQNAEIKWYSFEDAVALSKKNPKKLFIDVYTHWCGWCKRMDATTFKDPAIVDYLNKNYYPIKLDAETKDTILFADKAFVFQPAYKANEIALSLLGGKMSYPSYVFLSEEFEMLTPVPGYLDVAALMNILKYFGDGIYKTVTWEEYSKTGK